MDTSVSSLRRHTVRGGCMTPAAHSCHSSSTRRVKHTVRVLASLLLKTAGLLLPSLVSAASPADDPRNIYLMDLVADGHTLAEAVVSYESGGHHFVHFASFLSAVEFPIEHRGRVWAGWFRTEETRFSWNLDEGTVRIAGGSDNQPRNARWIQSDASGSTCILEDRQWLETGEGVFVILHALERWFELELYADTRAQVIRVGSSEPLPFEQRLKRTSERNGYRSTAAGANRVRVPDQYRWTTLPLVDLTVNHRLWNAANGETDSSTDLALTASMDLLKHSTVYSGNINGGPQRLTMKRGAATSADTLPLGATRYMFGDVVAAPSSLVGGTGTGAGFRIERQREGHTGSLNLLTIAGDAPPGWDTELYRNGVLITFGSVGGDGRYVFPEQETVYGENVFLVRLFGPRGEVEERRHVHWGGGTELAKGEFNFSLGHVDFSRDFLDGPRDGINGLAAARMSDIRYAYALSDDLQIGLAYTSARLGSREANGSFEDTGYGALDARMNVGRGLLLTEFVRQQADGSAISASYLTTLAGQNLSLSHQSFRDFESPYTVRNVKLHSQNQLSLAGPMSVLGLDSYALRVTHENRADGLLGYRVFNRLGASWGPANVSHDLEYVYVESGDPSYRGYLRITGRRGQLNFRAEVDYNPARSEPVNQLAGTVSWAMSRRVNTSLTLRRNMNDGQTYVESRSSFRLGGMNLSLDLHTGADDSWSAAIGFNTRVGYDADTAGFFSADRSLAYSGRARMQLFLDHNNNGSWDSDERPLPWASYKGRTTSAAAPGVLSLTGLPSETPITVHSRDLLFDDPFLSAADDVYELYTHAGSDVDVYIPVIVTGDVEGYLYPGSGMDHSDLRGVAVALYDSDGQEIATTRSEFDGYYSFSSIPAGEYYVVVTPYTDRAGYHLQRFSLGSDDNYRMLDPIYLWSR